MDIVCNTRHFSLGNQLLLVKIKELWTSELKTVTVDSEEKDNKAVANDSSKSSKNSQESDES